MALTTTAICNVDGCAKYARGGRGFCINHYKYKRRHGELRPLSTEERFWAKVDKNGPLFNGEPCWVWTAAISDTGYGSVSIGDRRKNTHRAAYEMLVGPVPDGLHLDHLCRNRPCCNPSHLEPVTPAENIRRAFAGKTHCKRGHDLSDAYINNRGQRQCRTCVLARQGTTEALAKQRERRRRKKEEARRLRAEDADERTWGGDAA